VIGCRVSEPYAPGTVGRKKYSAAGTLRLSRAPDSNRRRGQTSVAWKELACIDFTYLQSSGGGAVWS
jgi:hypothetical protein